MKYDLHVSQLAPILQGAQNILIVLPTEVTIDRLAAGLALYLSLKSSAKNASIVSEGIITAGHAALFGVGEVKNQIPASGSGDYTITLGGVVAPDGRVPTLQNLDWAPAGPNKADLRLVFHTMPGQKFEPTFVTPAYEGGSFDLVITVGAKGLASLGGIYAANPQVFSGGQILNIDNQADNTQFGTINLSDNSASSLSEIVGLILPALSLPYQSDIASNILAGIFEATANMQTATPDSFEAVANALRAGGQKPSAVPNTAPMQPNISFATPAQPAPAQPEPATPASALPIWAQAPTQSPQPQGLDVSPFLSPQNFSVTPADSQTTPAQPEAVPAQPQPMSAQPEAAPQEYRPSAEETPMGEAAQTESPEADWLTPKIFKSSKIG